MSDPKDDARWVEVDRRTLTTAADPEKVWEAWARPERLRQWFPDDARGAPEPGGELVHVWSSFGGMEMPHRVLAAEPGRRLLLEADGPAGLPFRQEILVEREGGATVLELVHYGFEDGAGWDGDLEGIDSGWQLALALLRHYLEEHFGRDRQAVFHMRPTTHDFDSIQPLFREAEGLARWLTRSARSGSLVGKTVGDPVSLELGDGDGGGDAPDTLTGHLLADSGRELALSWEEIDAVLELKIFPAGPEGLAAALRCSAWGMDEAAAERLGGRLAASLGRLTG